jgi:probable selenium-dependent hydroxylase accessory protein YqeC
MREAKATRSKGGASMGLLSAVGAKKADVIAVVGAGGKTTLVYGLAAEARAAGLSVLVTTTTHTRTLAAEIAGPVLFDADTGTETTEAALQDALRAQGRATLLGRRIREDKLEGVAPERVDALAHLADLVLVEADGARGRSLKVPAEREPVVPRATTRMIVLAAMDALGEPLDDRRVHRVERVALATGRSAGDPIDEDSFVAALAWPLGYPARISAGLRSGVFLNKIEDAHDREAAGRIARRLVPPYGFVAGGSARGADACVLA